jgi:hypothetical protein
VRLKAVLLVAALMVPCMIAGCVVLAAPAAIQENAATVSESASAKSVIDVPVIYTAAKQYAPLSWLHGGERFPQGAMLMVHDAKGERILSDRFVASADANVSFDGKSVLFTGKQHTGDAWQAWVLSFKDGQFTQLTKGNDDIIKPMYLPANRIVYARKSGNRFVLEALSLSDGKAMPLSYAPGSYLPTDVLRDGRILFSSNYPLGTDGAPEIYAVYTDGTGVESYRCDHGMGRSAGRELSSGDIVFPSGKGLARFTSPRAQQVAFDSPAGDYAGDVVEANSHSLLTAWRQNSKQPYQIELLNTADNQASMFLSQAESNLLDPVLVARRPIPNRHPSTLRDWTAANLLSLDSYTSKYAFVPGSIANVRVYTVDGAGQRKLLGTAPVEKDGSFYVHVPGDVPLQFELIGNNGKLLKREAGWFWARKSEQRICVGCHAGPEHAPENAVPAVLLRTTTPVDMTTTQAAGSKGAK